MVLCSTLTAIEIDFPRSVRQLAHLGNVDLAQPMLVIGCGADAEHAALHTDWPDKSVLTGQAYFASSPLQFHENSRQTNSAAVAQLFWEFEALTDLFALRIARSIAQILNHLDRRNRQDPPPGSLLQMCANVL